MKGMNSYNAALYNEDATLISHYCSQLQVLICKSEANLSIFIS